MGPLEMLMLAGLFCIKRVWFDLLEQWREPAHECESLTSIPIRRTPTQGLPRVLLVEAEPDIGHKPSELDNDEGHLEPNEAHDGRERHVCHGQCLRIRREHKY